MDEIIKKIRRFALKIEDEHKCVELDDIADELEYFKEDLQEESIIDLEKFKRQLEQQNMMSSQLEEFIENYMRFDNRC